MVAAPGLGRLFDVGLVEPHQRELRDVHEARQVREPREEDPQLVIACGDLHFDGVLVVELQGLACTGLEALEVHARLLTRLRHLGQQTRHLVLIGQQLFGLVPAFLELLVLALETRQVAHHATRFFDFG